MEHDSPYSLARLLERTISGIISRTDIYMLDVKPREMVLSLKRLATDARLDIRDYEAADSRNEQIAHAHKASVRLGELQSGILATSEYGTFNAVDIVQLSTWIDRLQDQLE